MFLNVNDVMKLFDVSKAYAYRLIIDLNKQLEEQGYRTIRGKVPRQYVLDCFYIKEDKLNVSIQR